MYKNIKDFFKKELPHLQATDKLVKKLRIFRLGWATKSDDYVRFLGSKLLGVHIVRFSVLDDTRLMEDVLEIKNWKELQEKVYKVKGIEKNYKTGSNIIYLTLAYISHLYMTDRKLNSKVKEEGLRESCLILQYKMFASLYTWYFKFSTTESIALTVYNKLSHKYLIKQFNSWQDVFEYRVKTCLDKHNPNYKRLMRFNAEDSVRIVSDIQTKLREQVKQIYKILIEVIDNKEAIQHENDMFIGGENEEEQIKDLTQGAKVFIDKLQRIMFNYNEFYDPNILDIVDRLSSNINRDLTERMIKCMTDENFIDNKTLSKLIETIMLDSLAYLQRLNINVQNKKYLPKIIVMLKNYWSSSKVKNKNMEEVKKLLQKKAFECTNKKTKWVHVGLALNYILYVFLRAMKD